MPILNPHSLEFLSRSPEQTRRFGMRVGAMLRPGDVVCLLGDLGAGKTTLVQGISAGWGSLDAVSSPTFVLVNVYRHPEGKHMYHVDAYRLSGATEAIDLDLDTMLENGSMVVEWAERVQEALPAENLTIHITYIEENQRDLLLVAHGEYYRQMVNTLRKDIYGG